MKRRAVAYDRKAKGDAVRSVKTNQMQSRLERLALMFNKAGNTVNARARGIKMREEALFDAVMGEIAALKGIRNTIRIAVRDYRTRAQNVQRLLGLLKRHREALALMGRRSAQLEARESKLKEVARTLGFVSERFESNARDAQSMKW